MKELSVLWQSRDGSIFTMFPVKVKLESGAFVEKHFPAIAFNVGREAADHIVKLHNAPLYAHLEMLAATGKITRERYTELTGRVFVPEEFDDDELNK